MMRSKKGFETFICSPGRGFGRFFLGYFLLAFSSLAFSLKEPEIGDRVVLMINNVPFTQRQIEGYINIKESLRKNVTGSIRLVDGASWDDALSVFTLDAILLLEAQRIGGVSVPDSLAQKYLQILKEKSSAYPEIKVMLARLGLSDGGLERAIDAVLRVAAFRRSRERQETQSQLQLKAGALSEGTTSMPSWQRELIDRAIIRRYDDSGQYVVIQPTAGG